MTYCQGDCARSLAIADEIERRRALSSVKFQERDSFPGRDLKAISRKSTTTLHKLESHMK